MPRSPVRKKVIKPARSAARTARSCCLNPARRSGANHTTAIRKARRTALKIQLARARWREREGGRGEATGRDRLMADIDTPSRITCVWRRSEGSRLCYRFIRYSAPRILLQLDLSSFLE